MNDIKARFPIGSKVIKVSLNNGNTSIPINSTGVVVESLYEDPTFIRVKWDNVNFDHNSYSFKDWAACFNLIKEPEPDEWAEELKIEI